MAPGIQGGRMKIYLIWRLDTLDGCSYLDDKIFIDREKAERYVDGIRTPVWDEKGDPQDDYWPDEVEIEEREVTE